MLAGGVSCVHLSLVSTILPKMITDVSLKIRIKLRILRIFINSKTINPHKNCRRYRYCRFLSSVGSWSVDCGAHIQAFTFSYQDHGRLSIVCISTHSPSHQVENLSRLRSVVDCAHIRAFTFSSQDHGRLIVRISKHSPSHHVENLSRLRSVVDCAHIRAFTFSSQDHGRLIVRISKHLPSHHVENLSRSRSVARRAQI